MITFLKHTQISEVSQVDLPSPSEAFSSFKTSANYLIYFSSFFPIVIDEPSIYSIFTSVSISFLAE